MANPSALNQTAVQLARLLPALGLMLTEPLPEPLRDSRSQMILMQLLALRGQATVSDLAAAMGIAVPTASTMIRRMVEKGLLDRTQDPDDWRTVRLSLSAAGQGLLAEMAARRAAILTGLLQGLSPAELTILAQATPILDRLTRRPAE